MTTSILYHTYCFYKSGKMKKRNKRYADTFIIFIIMLSIEQHFQNILAYIPKIYYIKFITILLVAFPFSNVSSIIFQNFIVKTLDRFVAHRKKNDDSNLNSLESKIKLVNKNDETFDEEMFDIPVNKIDSEKEFDGVGNLTNLKGLSQEILC